MARATARHADKGKIKKPERQLQPFLGPACGGLFGKRQHRLAVHVRRTGQDVDQPGIDVRAVLFDHADGLARRSSGQFGQCGAVGDLRARLHQRPG